MSRREEAKEERRQQILNAARDIIRETGHIGLSMRSLSVASNVSAATLYNLFGSKNEIVLQLFNNNLADFAKLIEEAEPRDALDRFFVSIHVACALYGREERFFRTSFGLLFANDPENLHSGFLEPRVIFFRRLARQAVREGWLDETIDINMLAVTSIHIFSHAIIDWIRNDIDLAGLERQLNFSFALVLGGAATDKARARVAAKLRDAMN
ncbi:MAG TPA: TetR/AcrR family transcriptional regulator [Pararhizobium sp.]|uniref:TetR/AcrR family transcriptional regulator n=1 Tax=Pararhizobium sp. TaxID=1977563 RepID=UPI002C142196|nr:TetR/AcrR family transcriptional regulator [Pararhizobium sp.]HTO32287.1 TetR/AcrR family transcriptional regulator [Pararhizobium sp.]